MPSAAERYAAARRRQAAANSELSRFATSYDFPFDDFQVQGCQALERGEGVLVAAPTGAGKTIVGEFAVHLGLVRGLKTFYTTPIKALSNQKYLDLAARYGQEAVGLLTGDTSVNPHAQVVVMTTEVLRNMLYSGSRSLEGLGFVVMDEVHYLADRFRGPVWEEVIIHLDPAVQVVSLSATVSNAEEFGDWLGQVRGTTAVVVSEHRPVPLTQHMMVGRRLMDLYAAEPAGPTGSPDTDTGTPPLNPDLVRAVKNARRAAAGEQTARSQTWRRGRRTTWPAPAGARAARLRPPSRATVISVLDQAHLLPAIVFVFSRNGCEQAVRQVVAGGADLTTRAQARQIEEVIERRTAAVPEGDLAVLGFHSWAHALQRGVAAHHAGLLPVFKETVEELFSAGLVKVVYATETLALGINMPARTVVLESLRKWNGSGHVQLTPGEYTQLTGRAGRRGIDTQGHAVVLAADQVEPQVVASLASRRTYPLVSAFRPTYNMAVNLLGRTSRARAREVLESSFAQFQADRGVVELAAQARRARQGLAALERQMECSHGDFREYAMLRQRLGEVQAELARANREGRRSNARHSMESLRRGDVVVYPRGRRRRHGVVLGTGTDQAGVPLLEVLGEDSRLVTLTPDTAPDGVVRVGALTVADTVDPRRPRQRDRLVRRLVDAIRSGDLAQDGRRRRRTRAGGQTDDGTGTDVGQVQALCHELRNHPCHACPDREEHARVGRRWAKALVTSERLQERIQARTGTIARLFEAVCEVLTALGYLEPVDRGHPERELRVTAAGRVLSRVYAERDLLIAQCLREGLWEDLGPAELAGAVSACVYEPRAAVRSVGPAVSPGSRLGEVLRAELDLSRRIHDLESLAQIESSSGAEPALAGAVLTWAQGAHLAQVLEDSDLTAGDFVRWCKQLLDVLGQISALEPALSDRDTALAVLAQGAAQASSAVNRGVLAWSAL